MALQDTKAAIISSEDPQRLTTPEGRISYPNLFRPRKNDRDEDRWDCQLIFEKAGFDKKPFNQIVMAAGEAEWGKDFLSLVKTNKLEMPKIHEGAEKPDDPALGPNRLFIRAASSRKPNVVDQNVAVIPDTEASRVYAGCYVRAAIRAYAYKTKNKQGVVVKQGISFGLQNVQLLRDGEPLGGVASDPTDDFGPVAAISRPAGAAGAASSAADDDLLGGAQAGALADELSL